MWKTFAAGVDWFTMTAGKGTDEIHALDDLGLELLSESLKKGHKIKPITILGYRGTLIGSVFVGFRTDGMMLRVSGEASHKAACMAKERVPYGQVSRIDFKFATQRATPDDEHGLKVFRSLDAQEFRTKKGRQVTTSFEYHPRRGDTLYLGSRTSDRFGRLYNKSLEQRGKIAPGVWQHEMEIKQKLARKAWQAFLAADSPTEIARQIVVAEFEARGVDLSHVDNSTPHKLPTTYEVTDEERQLEWLSSHVSKTAKKLESDLGTERVLQALGLKYRP